MTKKPATKYQQLSSEERFLIATLRFEQVSSPQIAAILKRDPSTIWREIQRNRSSHDGGYRTQRAIEKTSGRRKRSRKKPQFSPQDLGLVEELLREEWSPEQISGRLRENEVLSMSHETIYRHIWRDRKAGGTLHRHLRCAPKKYRKRYGRRDSRGRLAGKRMIAERPAVVESRQRMGDWEIDTVMGQSLGQSSDCILTLVERQTGYLLIGKLAARTVVETNRAILKLIARHEGRFLTVTSDNGTEFHGYGQVEKATGVTFYFANPHHSWERGTNENTNGLIRQYLPKGKSMATVTQSECDIIAEHLNNRPRKRLVYRTPNECFHHN
jgi:IS30 family transposase